ncbi:alpha/beta fold hydrolase [Actinoplanes sp. NPDC049681]|uniref:alpha/beta fold hydrolase n=1 Tax=Actinoplanes sp. NPDC049681 TaxID=3363905 RepID=UPI003797AFB4
MTQRFDLVALDPRGVGRSTPIRCRTPLRAPGVTRFPADHAAYDRLVAHNKAFADDCRRRNGSLADHLDLTSTARDFEAVRIALGEHKLDWYGIHYSTLLGRTYAALFPGRLRTMTLDTALDDTVPLVSRIADEATSAENAFNRFTAWCQAAATCALHGRDVAADYDALVARANAHPIPVPGGAQPPVTGEDIQAATQDYLNIAFLYWPMLATAITRAAAGDPTDFTADPDDTIDPVQLQVTACADSSATATYDQLAGLQRMLRQLSPHLGGAVRSWTALTGCLGRPVHRAPATPPVTRAPSTLIVQSTHQALAPYAAGFSLAGQLPGSVVLSRDGDDYSMFLLSGCVRDHVNRNLTDRKLAPPGTICTD